MLMIREDGALETFLVGDLRTDLDRAKQVADSGFQSLIDYQVGSTDDNSKLPRRIRKDESHEQRYNPVVRTRRR